MKTYEKITEQLLFDMLQNMIDTINRGDLRGYTQEHGFEDEEVNGMICAKYNGLITYRITVYDPESDMRFK